MKRQGRKIVLYQPQQVDPSRGYLPSFDLLPLEMLQIATFPERDGYEVVIIDASLYGEREAHQRAVQECREAIVFATTSILGFAVIDGHRAAEKVRYACPGIRIIAGGWFPSCLPEVFLSTGIYDAVAIGQGELTFRDFVAAAECGEPADSVAGLALWRDRQLVRTSPRGIVGWEQLPRTPWHLLDIEPYRRRQCGPAGKRARTRLPPPPSKAGDDRYFGISYFSSYGCPEPCTFCCSPELTARRWKAMPAERMLDDLSELHDRWGFEVVRFNDANWGVSRRRVADFCRGKLDRELPFEWSTTIETVSLLQYPEELLDTLKESGLYLIFVGGEAASEETMARIGKPIRPGDNRMAVSALHKRGIATSLSYIIGYPSEPAASMLETIEEARHIVIESPSVRAQLFPYQPIPGNPMYRQAVEDDYPSPKSLEEWGSALEYDLEESWRGRLPRRVYRAWRRFQQYCTLYQGQVEGQWTIWQRLAAWRLRRGFFAVPIDLKAFHVLSRLQRWQTSPQHGVSRERNG